MIPPIFPAVNVAAVQALLKSGANELRFYAWGRAPQNPVTPYAVWQTVFGSPENYLGNTPDADGFGTQINVYADPTPAGSEKARAVAQALRDALEPVAYITAWRGESRDPETGRYVYSFDCEWVTNR